MKNMPTLLAPAGSMRPFLTALRFGADAVSAFAMAGMAFSSFHILDGENQEDAPYLIADSDLIILAGGHVPTQNAFFRELDLDVLLQDYEGIILGIKVLTMSDEEYAEKKMELKMGVPA